MLPETFKDVVSRAQRQARRRQGIDEDTITLRVGGVSYRDWYEVDIDSDIFTPADAFMLRVATPEPQFVRAFREGMAVDVYVGEDRQMAGILDELVIDGDRSQTIMTLTGRDRGSLLVDNEANTIKASKYTIKTLAEKLIDPSFGIRRVLLENHDNRKLLLGKKDRKKKAGNPFSRRGGLLGPRATVKIDPGQKIAEVLDLHTRRLGMTWWLTAEGDLFIGKPEYNQHPAYSFVATTSECNVEKFSVRRGIAERYSEIVVNGVGLTQSGNLFATGSAKPPRFKGVARDPDLVVRGIKRKLIIADNEVLSNAEAQARADYEMGKRRLSGLVIQLTVDGFRQDGRLFAVDTLATVKIEEASIDGIFYVTQRRFVESRNQRRTHLTLHEKGVWLP